MIQEERQCLGGDLPRRRSPAEYRGIAPEAPPITMFLRRHGLQDDRINDCIPDERCNGQPHGERVHPPLVTARRARCLRLSQQKQRLARRELTSRQRTPASARHQRIDLLLDEAVHGRSRARDECDTGGAGEERSPRHGAWHREEHTDSRREDDERHDAGLRELIKLVSAGAERRLLRWEHVRSTRESAKFNTTEQARKTAAAPLWVTATAERQPARTLAIDAEAT